MTKRRARLSRLAAPLAICVGASVLGSGTITALASDPGSQATTAVAPRADDLIDPFTSAVNGLPDKDLRGSVAPTASQRRSAAGLDAQIRWNRYGTPQSILSDSGMLGPRTSDSPVRTARSWLTRHASVLGLSTTQIAGLDVVSDQRMRGSKGHAVLFRQVFDGLTSAVDGMVTVGVSPRGVAYVSSSLAKADPSSVDGAQLSPQDAWVTAANDVGITDVGAVTELGVDDASGFTQLGVAGIVQEQQVRLRALALTNGTVRPVYETNVVDVADGESAAYTSFVDAADGTVYVRHNQTDNVVATGPSQGTFEGAITATQCGPDHPFTVGAGNKTINVFASAAVPTNDIVLKLVFGGQTVASSDTATSPEAIAYSPGGELPTGEYVVQVCPFDAPTVPFVEPGNYTGTFSASEQGSSTPGPPYPPAWKFFLSNPSLDFSAKKGAGPRATGCWVPAQGYGCTNPPGPLTNLAARSPWDVDPRTDKSTNTTSGNSAVTAEAWTTPLSPGAFGQRPIEPDRKYYEPFDDVWNNTKCNPINLVPGGNDILSAVINLFASHNRIHDFAYFLGFTEANYNLQQSNFGSSGVENDPEVGNVQAGAISGGSPSYLGRDNANQITLQDGVPGITNQYLFQPIAGAFYAPCVDGDVDATVFGHEYTHAITNRMVAGPDAGLSGFQAGSMGEAWSDQVALEYLFEHSFSTGASPWVEGPYVTGNRKTGIRNYALNRNPLQYGDLGYDSTGPEVHADGEVWNAAMWNVRQALVKRYQSRFPYGDKTLQLQCAEGFKNAKAPRAPESVRNCPGNRRWLALMFDSYLLQQSASSMLDARDAFLAADRMRFPGHNQAALWDAFARSGMGKGAKTRGTDDAQPVPSYTSPLGREGTLTVRAVNNQGRSVSGRLFVSHYEARITPVADTNRKTKTDNRLPMVPGTYFFTFQAPGYGISHFTQRIQAGRTSVKTLRLSTNLASKSSGAKVNDKSPGSLNARSLIDDTQDTNWGVDNNGVNVDEQNPFIDIDLAGGQHLLKTVRVSALLNPASESSNDQDSGSRFTALRQFAIAVCTKSASRSCDGSGYRRVFTSANDAFNSVRPRPLSPQLLLKTFNIPDVRATHVRLVVLENQCTGTKGYAGEQDKDPLNATDCKTESDRGMFSHVAELQVFG